MTIHDEDGWEDVPTTADDLREVLRQIKGKGFRGSQLLLDTINEPTFAVIHDGKYYWSTLGREKAIDVVDRLNEWLSRPEEP